MHVCRPCSISSVLELQKGIALRMDQEATAQSRGACTDHLSGVISG